MPPLNTGVETIGMPVPPASEMEVDYDKNITTLYQAITSCEWDKAIHTAKDKPKEAQTWVVRHYEKEEETDEPPEIMWRFLPIHSACARQPPASVISALIRAYPDGAKCIDDQGMYPLHYACGNQASREVIRLLLVAFPQAAKLADPRGMLPIHYLACWGPSSVSIIDMILVANRDVSEAKDADGNTALDLALEGEYSKRDAVVAALKRWLEKGTSRGLRTPSPASRALTVNTATPATEEKADEADPDKSPRTVSRLRHQITKLKSDHKIMEEAKEKEIEEIVADYSSKIQDLEQQLEATKQELEQEKQITDIVKEELAQEKERSDEFQAALQEKEELLMNTEDRLAEATQNLVSAEEERDQLSEELSEMTEEYDHYKKKYENMTDRLGSLTASLTSMAEMQSKLTSQVQDREERMHSAAEVRIAKLQALMDFETQLMLKVNEGEESNFTEDFEQQQKEMDAIAAVIAAMRQ